MIDKVQFSRWKYVTYGFGIGIPLDLFSYMVNELFGYILSVILLGSAIIIYLYTYYFINDKFAAFDLVPYIFLGIGVIVFLSLFVKLTVEGTLINGILTMFIGLLFFQLFRWTLPVTITDVKLALSQYNFSELTGVYNQPIDSFEKKILEYQYDISPDIIDGSDVMILFSEDNGELSNETAFINNPIELVSNSPEELSEQYNENYYCTFCMKFEQIYSISNIYVTNTSYTQPITNTCICDDCYSSLEETLIESNTIDPVQAVTQTI